MTSQYRVLLTDPRRGATTTLTVDADSPDAARTVAEATAIGFQASDVTAAS